MHKYCQEELDIDFYKNSNPDLSHLSHTELENHWKSFGIFENRFPNKESFNSDWQKLSLETEFSYINYLICNPDLNFVNEIDAQMHYLNFGRFENRPYFVKLSNQLKQELINLYKSFGIEEFLPQVGEVDFEFLFHRSSVIFSTKLLTFDFEISELRKEVLAQYELILNQIPAPSTLSLVIDLFQRIYISSKDSRVSLLFAILRVEIFRLIQNNNNSINRDLIHPIGLPKPIGRRIFEFELIKLKKSKLKRSIYKSVDLITMAHNKLRIAFRKRLPKLSLIASIYNGDEFIESFLKNITSTKWFWRCELIIVDANSPGNELNVIKTFQEKFSNIKYIRTETRIGIYEAWNLAIQMAEAPYISNANVDDLHCRDHFVKLVKVLDANPEIKVAYGNFYYSIEPNIAPWMAKQIDIKSHLPLTTKHGLLDFNAPHCAPIWRKSLHSEIGYFDEKFRSAGDWEFWLRAAKYKHKFGQTEKSLSVYYINPDGISTSVNSLDLIEQQIIRSQYIELLVEEDEVISILS